MREIARFAMKGPKSAAVIAFIACLVPMMFWLGAATVALVTLRHGLAKGLNVFIWAVIPALGWWLGLQDPTAMVVLICTFASAEVLRRSISMRQTLLFGFGLSVLLGALSPVLMPEAIDKLMMLMDEVLKQLASDTELTLDDELKGSFQGLIIGSFAASFYSMSIGSLFLARSWQAALYNPGGWREEFHQLRLGPIEMTTLIVVGLLASSIGYVSLVVFTALVPITICGLALFHGVVGKKNLGGHWMIGFYALVIVLFPTSLALLAFLAMLDSAIDFRDKVQASPNDG